MTTKKVISGLVLLLIFMKSYAQVVPVWAYNVGGTGNDEGSKITHDTNGNVYATGFYNGNSITIGSFTLTNTTGSGYYIVKYNANGNVIWVYSPTITTGGVRFSYISCDASGNIVTGGPFTGTITLGSTVITNAGVSPTRDVFAVKLDASGNVIWATSASGTGDEDGGACTDASGNVFLTGNFRSNTVTVGTATLNLSPASSLDQVDIFMAKFDPAGNFLWANAIGGSKGDKGFNLTTDASGNVFLSGNYFSDTLVAGNDTLINADTTGFGSNDALLVKYNSNGAIEWARSPQGGATEFGYAVACDAVGNVIIGGSYDSGTISFDSVSYGNAGQHDIYLAKYSSGGHLIWAKRFGGADYEYVSSISTNAALDIVCSGVLSGTGTLNIGSTTLTSNGGYDALLFKLPPFGSPYWAKNYGGVYDDISGDVCLQDNNDINVVGTFKSPTLDMGGITLTNNGNFTTDLFVAKLNSNTFVANHFEDEQDLQIFPNPASNGLTIAQLPEGGSQICIKDMSGRLVMEMKTKEEFLYADIEKLVPGHYLVEVLSTTRAWYLKFVKR